MDCAPGSPLALLQQLTSADASRSPFTFFNPWLRLRALAPWVCHHFEVEDAKVGAHVLAKVQIAGAVAGQVTACQENGVLIKGACMEALDNGMKGSRNAKEVVVCLRRAVK